MRVKLSNFPKDVQNQLKKMHVEKQTPISVHFVIPGNPMGKPRMTRRDKWAKRVCVVRYREWKDLARLYTPRNLPESPKVVSWVAYFEMPMLWSAKKKQEMVGKPHCVKPDRDNVDKGLLDLLFENDSCVSDGTLSKRWDDGKGPRLEVLIQ